MNYIRTGVLIVALMTTMTIYSQQTSNAYQTQIDQLNKEMADNLISGNFEKSMDLYTKDAILMLPYENMREGADAIRKGLEDMSASGVKFTSFEPKTTKLIPEGNFVIEIGTIKMTLTSPGSSQPINEQGKYVTVWEKQSDGSLKIKVDTWNSDSNPMNGMQPGQGLSQPGQSTQPSQSGQPVPQTPSVP